MLCSICFNEIPKVGDWDSGNNAYPVNHGRCCNDCDNKVVIPARITLWTYKVSNDVLLDMQREQFRSMAATMGANSALRLHGVTRDE